MKEQNQNSKLERQDDETERKENIFGIFLRVKAKCQVGGRLQTAHNRGGPHRSLAPHANIAAAGNQNISLTGKPV